MKWKRQISVILSLFLLCMDIYIGDGLQAQAMESADKSERETLDFIYRLKTGALLEASMQTGAVMAGASEEDCERVRKMALAVGLAFQIQDDILDVTSSQEVLGKPVLSDEKNHKTTYVSLEGIGKAKDDVKALSEKAIRILKDLPGSNAFLEDLIRMLIYREK